MDKGYSSSAAAVAQVILTAAAWNELADWASRPHRARSAHGGMGQGAIDAMVVAEELGRGIVLDHSLSLPVLWLSHYAPAEVQSAWLPRVTGGKRSSAGASGATNALLTCGCEAKKRLQGQSGMR